MSNRRTLTRGDRRRNDKLARLRAIVRPDLAVVGIDLASAKQAAVVTDHDSIVLGRRMFDGDPWVIDEIVDWALPIAVDAGFTGVVVGCEPTGHRWKAILDRCRVRGVEVVCVNPMLVHRGREEEDFTRDRSDFKDSTIIARRVTDRHCFIPYALEGTGAGSVTWARAATTSSSRPPRPANSSGTCSSACGPRSCTLRPSPSRP